MNHLIIKLPHKPGMVFLIGGGRAFSGIFHAFLIREQNLQIISLIDFLKVTRMTDKNKIYVFVADYLIRRQK